MMQKDVSEYSLQRKQEQNWRPWQKKSVKIN